MTLLTAFQVLLSCLTGEKDIVIGSPSAGRNWPETEELIGYFVNTLVLRTKLEGDPDFSAALRRVRETALGAYGNQDVPFEKLVDELRPQRSLQFNPLFQVWFVLQNAPSERQEWRGLTVQPIDIDSATTRHDLQLALWETEPGPQQDSPDRVPANGLAGAFTYSTDLFDAETIERISEQFAALLTIVSEQPENKLSTLRAKLDAVGRAYRQQQAELLEDASREKLKSVKRRAVTGAQSSTTNSHETNVN
ncbi:MAG: hypothetical protein AUI36_06970 [Cyanobacteria bacterium 13_1_40CM_2_61_4]|nr:MAG: hypothetical protein AUI36_06970 [Cyanobacteria bacterium 13_1_40CM_2_61_4]